MAAFNINSKEVYCRICEARNAIVSLFSNGIVEKIKICTGVKFLDQVNSSRHICMECCKDLQRAFQFREKCLKANQIMTPVTVKDEEVTPYVWDDHDYEDDFELKLETMKNESWKDTEIPVNSKIVEFVPKNSIPEVKKTINNIDETTVKSVKTWPVLEVENFSINSINLIGETMVKFFKKSPNLDAQTLPTNVIKHEEPTVTVVKTKPVLEVKNSPNKCNYDSKALVKTVESCSITDIQTPPNLINNLGGTIIKVAKVAPISESKKKTRKISHKDETKVKKGRKRPLTEVKNSSKRKLKSNDKPPIITNIPIRKVETTSVVMIKIRKELSTKKYVCKTCQMGFDTQKEKQLHKKTHRTPVICEICGNYYKSMIALIEHRKIHRSISYHCNDCNYKTSHKHDLIIHMVVHQDFKKFQCPICSRRFALKNNLLRHTRRVHEKEKRFSCNDCGKKFYEKSVLVRHSYVHTGYKPYQCVQCYKEFSKRYVWASHMLSQHNVRVDPKKPGRQRTALHYL